METHFRKYHSLGNDYLVIDPSLNEVELTPDAIRLICDRNFGVGADGILYGPIKTWEVLALRIFNPDGSEAEKSGNGLRIFAKYLFEHRYVRRRNFNIKTLSGTVEVQIEDDTATLISVNMGKVTFLSTEIPVEGHAREVVAELMEVNGAKYEVTCLSIGNPHCVIPVEDISEEQAKRLGPHIENHQLFPNRTNVQFLKIIDRSNIEIRIWERGAGYTLASGSSACAAAAAAQRLGLANREVNVKMPGGVLLVETGDEGDIRLTGPAEGVFEGRFHDDLARKLSATGLEND